MDELILREFVYARNSRRSAERAAEGFASGQRSYSLREAIRREQQLLLAIADWAEEKAREALNLEPLVK